MSRSGWYERENLAESTEKTFPDLLKSCPVAVEGTMKMLELKMQMTRKAGVGLRDAIDQGHKNDFEFNHT